MHGKKVAAMVLVAALHVGVTGCTDDAGSTAEGSASPSSASPSAGAPGSATPSASPSPAAGSPSAEPTPSVPAPPVGKNNRKGQVAFARYAADAWAYALNSNDAGALLALSPRRRPCAGCRQLKAELRRRAAEGWHVELPGLEVRSVRTTRNGADTVARMRVRIPASDSYNDDGTFRGSSPAHPSATFLVEMTYTKKGFRLVSFSVRSR